MGPGCQPEGRALLAWAGASGRPRREGKKRKELAHTGLGLGKREVSRPRAEETGPRGKKPARGGREEQAGLGWELGLLSYFLPFFFSNQLKSI
jgi:hypothetical protein